MSTTSRGPAAEVQQRAGKRPSGSAGQDRTPPGLPSTLYSNRWLGPGFGFRQQAQERRRLPRPTARRLHMQAQPGEPCRRVPPAPVSPFFQAPGIDQRHSVTLSCTGRETPAWCQGRAAPPPKRGSPSATTSSLRPSSAGCATPRSKSRTMMLVVTRAPASRHTFAAAISTAKPRRASKQAREHAARWWPKESQGAATTTDGNTRWERQAETAKQQQAEKMRLDARVQARRRSR